MILTTVRDLSRVVVVVAVVVSVVSLLSLLLFGLITVDSGASSKFLPRTYRRDDQPSIEFLDALPLTDFGVTLVVQMLASLLPVLLSLPVLQFRHRRSMHARYKWEFSSRIRTNTLIYLICFNDPFTNLRTTRLTLSRNGRNLRCHDVHRRY